MPSPESSGAGGRLRTPSRPCHAPEQRSSPGTPGLRAPRPNPAPGRRRDGGIVAAGHTHRLNPDIAAGPADKAIYNLYAILLSVQAGQTKPSMTWRLLLMPEVEIQSNPGP